MKCVKCGKAYHHDQRFNSGKTARETANLLRAYRLTRILKVREKAPKYLIKSKGISHRVIDKCMWPLP